MKLQIGTMGPTHGDGVNMDDDTRDLRHMDGVTDWSWFGDEAEARLRVTIDDDAHDAHDELDALRDSRWHVSTYSDKEWNDYAEYEISINPVDA